MGPETKKWPDRPSATGPRTAGSVSEPAETWRCQQQGEDANMIAVAKTSPSPSLFYNVMPMDLFRTDPKSQIIK